MNFLSKVEKNYVTAAGEPALKSPPAQVVSLMKKAKSAAEKTLIKQLWEETFKTYKAEILEEGWGCAWSYFDARLKKFKKEFATNK